MQRLPICATAMAVATALSTPAFAHVSLETTQAAVGSSYEAVLTVPHGCSQSPTTEVALKVPDGFLNAEPQPKAGWKTSVESGAYETSHSTKGTKVMAGPLVITWSGGSIPADRRDEFVVRGVLADDLKPGTILYFKFVQTCAKGEEAWIGTSGDDEGSPAPALLVIRQVGP
jgi:uncharacterized protein YcnI